MLLRTIDESRPRVRLTVDGATVEAFEGETVAACLLRHDMAVTRLTPSGRKRGPYCLMGACFECVVEIDGKANVQACLTAVCDGMSIRRGLP